LKPGEVKATPRLLTTFAALAEASESDVRQFAARYGPLGVGRVVQSRSNGARNAGEASEAAYGFRPAVEGVYLPGSVVEEGVGQWRSEAKRYSALWSLCADLTQSRPTSTDQWKLFEPEFDEPVEAWVPAEGHVPAGIDRSAWAAMDPVRQRRLLVRDQRAAFALLVERSLERAGVGIGFYWEPRRTGIDYVGWPSLRIALALGLADMVRGGDVPYRCFNCGREYRPKRSPAWNRRNFCTRPECQESRKRHHRSSPEIGDS
jgi:hypothetical protein